MGQPGSFRQPLPRSPHKRVLPQTPETWKEDGLWSAEAPRASTSDGTEPLLLDYPLPFVKGVESLDEKVHTLDCFLQMDQLIRRVDWDGVLKKLDKKGKEKWCVSASLYKQCGDSLHFNIKTAQESGQIIPAKDIDFWEAWNSITSAWKKQACNGVVLQPRTQKVLEGIVTEYKARVETQVSHGH